MATTHFSGPVAVGASRFTAITTAATAYTITAAQNGTTFLLSGTGGTINLPSVTDNSGLEYTFIINGAFSTDYVITAQTAVLNGTIMEAGVVQLVAADTTITIEDGVEVIGDYINVICDGTSWFVKGSTSTAASVTPA